MNSGVAGSADAHRVHSGPESARRFTVVKPWTARAIAVFSGIGDRSAAEQLLHGEPHPGNVLHTKTGLFSSISRRVAAGRSSSTSPISPKMSASAMRVAGGDLTVVLPADGHVHSEWSWDAVNGSMEQTCARAVAIGLPAVAFTEHADYTPWTVPRSGPDADPQFSSAAAPEGTLTAPELDLSAYLECLQRCREQFPGLHIISGVELGEPHWHGAVVARLLSAGQFDRVLGSLHCLPLGQHFPGPPDLYRQRPAAWVIREYLAEIARLIEGTGTFSVLAHIDYPLRSWPPEAGTFDPSAFQASRTAAVPVSMTCSRRAKNLADVPSSFPMCRVASRTAGSSACSSAVWTAARHPAWTRGLMGPSESAQPAA